MPDPFDERARALRADVARELYSRAEGLGYRVEKGGYDDADLSELRFVLKHIRDNLVGNDSRLSEIIGISARTIATTYSGVSRPKYTNFMKMLYGAKKILSEEIAKPGSQNVNLGYPKFPDQSGETREIRIRSDKSNIFLSEADLKLVQNLAQKGGTQISNVISEGLRLFNEQSTNLRSDIPDPANVRPGQRPLLINRHEIIRYSTALIAALQEAADYDPLRHHNEPPPSLRIDDPDYLAEVRSLVAELKRLNSILEAKTVSESHLAEDSVSHLAKHFDTFFGAYAKSLGHGAAALTIATVLALLTRAGVGAELVDAVWSHWQTH